MNSVMAKKKKGVKLNQIERKKYRKIKAKFEKSDNTPKIERKRKLSVSLDKSFGSIKEKHISRKKRVSFANELEKHKFLDSFDDSMPISTPNSMPSKGILAKEARFPKQRNDKLIGKTTKKLQNKEKNENNEEVVISQKRKAKIQVTKKTKQKLLEMPRKERKAYIRLLKAKKRPNFNLATQCKALWEKIRSGKTTSTEKDQLIDQLVDLVSGQTRSLIYAHDTSRVIECLMKVNRPTVISKIFQELTPELVRMSKSKYARFLVVKMLRHGTPQQRSTIIDSFRGHVTGLIRNKWGAELLESAYNVYANAQQRSDIVIGLYGREFALFSTEKPVSLTEIINKEPAKRRYILRNLEELLKDLADKSALKHSITHRILNEFLENCDKEQKQEMIALIRGRIVELIHTRDGAHLGLKTIWNGSAKDRKIIVKSFKGLSVNACLDEFGSLVLMAIFDTVDDTVLVNKYIVKEIGDDIKKVFSSKYGLKVINYLIEPRNNRQFLKETVELLSKGDGNEYSKKSKDDRYHELWAGISEPLLAFLAANMKDLIFETSTSLTVLNALSNERNSAFDRNVTPEKKVACYKAITELAGVEFTPFNMDDDGLHLVEHPCAHFVVVQLLANDRRQLAINVTDQNHQCTLAGELASIPPTQLASWTACNKGCFVLLKMYQSGDEKAAEVVKKVVKMSTISLKTYTTKGAGLLVKNCCD